MRDEERSEKGLIVQRAIEAVAEETGLGIAFVALHEDGTLGIGTTPQIVNAPAPMLGFGLGKLYAISTRMRPEQANGFMRPLISGLGEGMMETHQSFGEIEHPQTQAWLRRQSLKKTPESLRPIARQLLDEPEVGK